MGNSQGANQGEVISTPKANRSPRVRRAYSPPPGQSHLGPRVISAYSSYGQQYSGPAAPAAQSYSGPHVMSAFSSSGQQHSGPRVRSAYTPPARNQCSDSRVINTYKPSSEWSYRSPHVLCAYAVPAGNERSDPRVISTYNTSDQSYSGPHIQSAHSFPPRQLSNISYNISPANNTKSGPCVQSAYSTSNERPYSDLSTNSAHSGSRVISAYGVTPEHHYRGSYVHSAYSIPQEHPHNDPPPHTTYSSSCEHQNNQHSVGGTYHHEATPKHPYSRCAVKYHVIAGQTATELFPAIDEHYHKGHHLLLLKKKPLSQFYVALLCEPGETFHDEDSIRYNIQMFSESSQYSESETSVGATGGTERDNSMESELPTYNEYMSTLAAEKGGGYSAVETVSDHGLCESDLSGCTARELSSMEESSEPQNVPDTWNATSADSETFYPVSPPVPSTHMRGGHSGTDWDTTNSQHHSQPQHPEAPSVTGRSTDSTDRTRQQWRRGVMKFWLHGQHRHLPKAADGTKRDLWVTDPLCLADVLSQNFQNGERLICLSMTDEQRSYKPKDIPRGVPTNPGVTITYWCQNQDQLDFEPSKPCSAIVVDLHFEAPVYQPQEKYIYTVETTPATIEHKRPDTGGKGHFLGLAMVTCDWESTFDDHLRRGWKLVDVFLDFRPPQHHMLSGYSLAMTQFQYRFSIGDEDIGDATWNPIDTQTLWIFEKPASHQHDSTQVYEGKTVPFAFKFERNSAVCWDEEICSMGREGWELACFVDRVNYWPAKEPGRSGTKTMVESLLFFQRPVSSDWR